MQQHEITYCSAEPSCKCAEKSDVSQQRSRTARRCCLGDGTFRRRWSQMFYAKKMCIFKILWRL